MFLKNSSILQFADNQIQADQADDDDTDQNDGNVEEQDPLTNFSAHVESCLLATDPPPPETAAGVDQDDDQDTDDLVDVDGQEFEEYEWAGQRRVRATALIEGIVVE